MTLAITISNDGPAIADTNYWQSEHAARGLCYLSGNAGVWRLLVPPAAAAMLEEMRTGRPVIIEPARDPRCWAIVFDDGSDAPFVVELDRRQVDRAMTAGSTKHAVWTESGRAFEVPAVVAKL